MDELKCPICGRVMVEVQKDDIVSFQCDNGHERVMVKFEYTLGFVFLGDGCYIAFGDGTSCAKAIGRMKLEYDMEQAERNAPEYHGFV